MRDISDKIKMFSPCINFLINTYPHNFMTHINLYEDEDFLITASNDHFDKVVIFLNPAAGLDVKGVTTVHKSKFPPVKMLAGLYTADGISEINFWSKNAHWYQRPALDACIAVLRKAIGGREQQTVIYGSSMGGFGALHVGSELNITVAAFSPQVTLDESFNIHPEWQTSLDYTRHHLGFFKSNVLEGKYSKSPIYIFYDGKHPLEEKHISYLRHHCRQATFFNIPYSGYTCTGIIHQHYGLKRLIIEIIDGTFSPSKFRKKLFSSFTIAEKKPFTGKEYFFYLQDIIKEPADRLLFLGPQEYQYKKLCSRLLNIIYTINQKYIHDIVSCMCDRRSILLHAVKFLPKSNHALARILDNEFTRIEACADFYFNKKFYHKAAFLYQKLYNVQNGNIYLARQLAYSLYRAGHAQEARIPLQHYLEKKGEHSEILSSLGELALADGELKLARKYLAASLRLQKTVPACLHYAQSLEKETGNSRESVLFLEKYRSQFSYSGEFLAWLGRYQINAGKLADGRATLTKASILSSCPAWAAELLRKSTHQPEQIRTYCSQLWGQVKTACLQVKKNIPTPANLLIQQAEEAMRQQHYSEALQRWAVVREKFPQNPRGYTGAAEACIGLRDFAQAEAFCQQGMASAPGAPGPLFLYAECAMRQQQYPEALQRWAVIRKKFPQNPRAYAGAAEACMELGDFAQAEIFCQQGMASAPGAPGPLFLYAECAMRQRQYPEALQRWTVVREKFPKNPRSYTGAAEACMELKDFAQAEAFCLQGIASVPGVPWPQIFYAECAMRQRQYQEALERWDRVRKQFPKNPRGYTGAVEACMRLEDFAQAEIFCQQGITSVPNAPWPLIFYAECAMRQQRYEEALDRWAAIREKFPNHPRGYIGAVNTYLFLQLPQKAKEICFQGLQQFQTEPYAVKAPLLYLHVDIFMRIGNPINALQKLLSLYKKDSFFHTDIVFWEKLVSSLIEYIAFILNKKGNINSSKEIITSLAYFLIEDEFLQSQQIYLLISQMRRIGICKQDIIALLQTAIKQFNITTNIAILLSTTETQDNQKKAIYNLLFSGNKRITQILGIQPQLKSLIQEVLNDILIKNLWQKLSEENFFTFVRILNFFDQDKADALIASAIQDTPNPHLETPNGVLAFRKHSQQKIYSKISFYNTKSKLDIALCISGQLRGYDLAFPHIMKAFDFQNHNTQIFVHTWESIGRKFPYDRYGAARTFSGKFLSAYSAICKGEEYLKTTYPNFYNMLTNTAIVTTEFLKNFYKTQHVAIENDNIPPFKFFHNIEKMLYKIDYVYKMTEAYHFDLVIWIRPDAQLQVPSQISLKNLYDRSFYRKVLLAREQYMEIPRSLYGYSIGETFILGTQDLMKIHANTYNDMKNIFWKHQAFSCPPQIIWHSSREFQLFAHGIKVEMIPNISCSFKDPQKLSIESIYDALKKDTATRVLTEDDKLLLSACEEDMSSRSQ